MLEKGVNISLLLDSYGPLLTDRQREIVGMYRNDDLSLGEISELTGITRQGVSECIRKAEDSLISYEEKLGLQRAYESRRALLSEIKDMIALLSARGDISNDSSEEIIRLLEKAEN